MANHKSAEKRIRQTKVRTERNRYYRTRIKNITRSVYEAIEANDVEKANEALKTANQDFHKFVSRGVLKKENASRKVSRLHKKVIQLSQSAAS